MEDNVDVDLLQLGWAVDKDKAAHYSEETETCEEEDVGSVSMIKEEHDEHVEPRSYKFQTLMMKDIHLERPHEYVSIGITCVSLEDGPYAGMRKGINSFSMPWMIFPWMAMMRPCTLEKQRTIVYCRTC